MSGVQIPPGPSTKMDNFPKELEKAKKQFILVEGKKDKEALESLGFENVLVINETGKSLYEKLEEVEKKAGKNKVCILTDFDKEGKKLYLKLKKELSSKNIKLDNTFRDKLLRKTNISHIEGIATILKK